MPIFSNFPHGIPIGTSAIALALLAPAAGADVLVCRDGTRIETRGSWQEKGRQLVFTSASGELSAIRADLIDLEASRTATARLSEAPISAAPPAPEDRPVVLRLEASELGLGEDPDLSFGAETRPVVMYGAAWCGVCRRTRELFDQIQLAYTYLDVDVDPAARAERDRRSGGRQVVPVVDWGGEIIIGLDGPRFLQLAKEDAEAAFAREVAAREKARTERAAASAEANGEPAFEDDDFAAEPPVESDAAASSDDSGDEPPPQPS